MLIISFLARSESVWTQTWLIGIAAELESNNLMGDSILDFGPIGPGV